MSEQGLDSTNPLVLLTPRQVSEACAEALQRGDGPAARRAFVQALREGPPRIDRAQSWVGLTRRAQGEEAYLARQRAIADDALQQRYVGVYGIAHQFEEAIDWHHDPTAEHGAQQTNEWTWQFNRHPHWVALAETWEATGDPRYAQAWERELRSWLDQCPRPSHAGTEPRSAWRPIEAGIRIGWRWPTVLEIFRRCPDVSDEALWRFAASFHAHGRHLLERPAGNNNMQAMICNGLAHAGFPLPELALADSFAKTGLDRAIGQLERQIYPDGLEDELAPGYGYVSFRNLYEALKIAAWAQPGPGTVPPRAWQRVGDIVEALGRLAAPNGRAPPIHDSPATDVASLYDQLARDLDATRFGPRPWQEHVGALLPWGGFAVLRDRAGGYALLDAGPEGTCHAHADALQVLIHDGARELAADPGKPRYDRSEATRHLKSACGHNVVLMDDRAHRAAPIVPRPETPFPIAYEAHAPAAFAAARRSARQEDGALFTHERLLATIEHLGWVVFDRLVPDDGATHRWHWLWHSEAERLAVEGEGAAGHVEGAPLFQVGAAGAAACAMQVVEGEHDPRLRGWRSGENGEPVPCPTLELTMEGAAPWLFTLFSPRAVSITAEAEGDSFAARLRAGDTAGRLVLSGELELTALRWEPANNAPTEHRIAPDTVEPG